MSTVEQSVDVDVPLHTAYNQWTQFEEFPHFMEGVEEVRQIDDRHTQWRTSIAGAEREFDAEIIDQVPDQRVSWQTVGGEVQQIGIVTFEPLGETRTRVSLTMAFEPGTITERAADALGIIDRRVKGDLSRFKTFIEARSHETGAWRGRLTPN
ncbi:SRPBCC family protein [Kitasatospora sp. NPDC101801]|uniref:SRPBCC family protein n=1 Tax=Kitasatospora sp. NPDC101801 TaxID=3364103 RepID=UPI00380D4236